MKTEELLKLPTRKWNDIKTYNSIIVIPSGEKHDSGWALMCIIGLDKNRNPIEIAAYCDDICWNIPSPTDYEFRNDMFFYSGAIHFWSSKFLFQVGSSLSSTDVSLIKKEV